VLATTIFSSQVNPQAFNNDNVRSSLDYIRSGPGLPSRVLTCTHVELGAHTGFGLSRLRPFLAPRA
jgi:hypothetical protein